MPWQCNPVPTKLRLPRNEQKMHFLNPSCSHLEMSSNQEAKPTMFTKEGEKNTPITTTFYWILNPGQPSFFSN